MHDIIEVLTFELQQMKAVSLVVPLYNEGDSFPQLRERLQAMAVKWRGTYRVEMILINDGSNDSTWEQIIAFAAEDPLVRGISLSRNFGHQIALFCGYEFSNGDAVISMDGDLQDPPEIAQQMLDSFESGIDIVYAVRKRRLGESLAKRLTAHMFYRLLNWLGKDRSPVDSGDFRLLSRRALEALLSMREKQKYIRGMVGWIGFNTHTIEYVRPPRVAGKTKYSWLKMVRFATDAIVSFSAFPLRLSFLLCLAAMVPFLGYIVYAFIASEFLGRSLVPGWSSLLLCVVVFGSLNLLALGIMGEYIGRMAESLRNRPDYLVMNVTSGEVVPRVRNAR